MSLLELFYMGGIEFMSLITLVELISFICIGVVIFTLSTRKSLSGRLTKVYLPAILFTGSLAFILGILGQIIGLYGAMIAIEQIGSVSQAMLAGGLKVSSITTLYGFVCLILSGTGWFLLRTWTINRQA